MQKRITKGAFISALSVTCSMSFGQSPIEKVLEYKPAPGQFINTSIGGPAAAKTMESSEDGFITLGGFGGTMVFKLKNPVQNDPLNPYGIDFALTGNASPSSSEPAVVWVMTDNNQNSQPDDTWYLLAGSDYWFTSSIHNYEVTYFNPDSESAANVLWEDNQGKSGYISSNEFHKQPYYPLSDSFPAINQDQYSLAGEYIHHRIDTSNPMLIETRHYPFGYVDNTPKNVSVESNLPDNPYTSEIEGMGGDSFDLSWAIDADGNYVKIEKADFIKIQNAVNYNFGRIGELSTEITQFVDIEPNSIATTDSLLTILEPVWNNVTVGSGLQMHACFFSWGKIQGNIAFNWSVKPDNLATIDQTGFFTPLTDGNVTVYASANNYPNLIDSTEITIVNPVNVNGNSYSGSFIYPNPANTFIRYSGEKATFFSIFDISGRLMMNGEMDQDFIDISSLKPGLYLFETGYNGQVINQRFLKQ